MKIENIKESILAKMYKTITYGYTYSCLRVSVASVSSFTRKVSKESKPTEIRTRQEQQEDAGECR